MIWGADGDIGSAIVAALTSDEWRTVAIGRYPERLAQATFAFEADVSQPFAVQQAVQATAMEIDTVDLWIYAVGDITSVRVGEMEPEIWQRIMNANLNGAYYALHHSLPLLAENAHIFFIGAVSERLRLPGLTAYVAAKAGLEAFVEALAKEERKRKISIVRPAAVQTGFWQKVPFRMPAKALSPADVAAAVISAYDQGQTGTLDL